MRRLMTKKNRPSKTKRRGKNIFGSCSTTRIIQTN